MSFSRRQFFRRFLGNEGQTPRRLERYETLLAYARTQLLPYDFSLTAEQEAELLSAVRSILETSSDSVLFSTEIRAQIEEIVEAKIEPWRNQVYSVARTERLREVRHAAPDYVSAFLIESAPSMIETLKQTFRIDDISELEAMLRRQIEDWINGCDDRLIDQCDVVTIKDVVFAQLRSWC
jgi:hypothetical protein